LDPAHGEALVIAPGWFVIVVVLLVFWQEAGVRLWSRSTGNRSR
jgi:hypothetical protein